MNSWLKHHTKIVMGKLLYGGKVYGKNCVGGFIIATFTMAIINTTSTFYMAPICMEFGFSIAGFLFIPRRWGCWRHSGGFTDHKVQYKGIMSAGAIVTAVCFASLTFAKQLWHFYLLWVCVILVWP